MYRSSYPLVWDLNDTGSADATKAQWAGDDGRSAPEKWPMEGSPGAFVGTYEGYVSAAEPTRKGFNFMGWSTVRDDPTRAGRLDALEIPKGTEPVAGGDGVKRITLYALWAPINYSVVFDLSKNPEDASAVPGFKWEGLKGTFSDLGDGRYRLWGVTLEDYDAATGLIEIATPSRGTGGYRFLSWAEPDSQQDPTVAMQPSGTSKWYVNPVALPYYDYEPVLTARWSLSFDVDVPSQITFDEYDSLEVEGNLTDTTDKDAIDEESPDLHDKGKLAHFCSQSTAADYKIVALKSEMQPTAKDILTSSDTVSEGGKYTQDYVLGSEKLLSLFAAGAASEGAGVHFKLDDAIDMDDSSRYGAFVIPKQSKEYSDADFSRDDEERLYVSYRLNLSNRVDGATESNHGLVTPGNVNEGDRTPIAKVSYEFAVADHEVETSTSSVHPAHCTAMGSTADDFYIEHGGKVYGPSDIKEAADCISQLGEESPCYGLYHSLLATGMDPSDASDPHGFVKWGDGITYPIRLIGMHQDRISGQGRYAGLTFQFVHRLRDTYQAYPTEGTLVGWSDYSLRTNMNSGTIWGQVPQALKDRIETVDKRNYAGKATTQDKLFLASYHEVCVWGIWDEWGVLAGEKVDRPLTAETPGTYLLFDSDMLNVGGGMDDKHTVHPLLREMVKYDGQTQYTWWRSIYGNMGAFPAFISKSGSPVGASYQECGYTKSYGVVPCFAL